MNVASDSGALVVPHHTNRSDSGASSSRRLIYPIVREMDALEAAYMALAVLVAYTAWVSLVLGELGLFSIGTLLLTELPPLAALVVLVSRGKVKIARHARSSYWPDVLLVPVLLISALLFWPPYELVFGAYDAGAYVNMGANLARTGSHIILDLDVASLPEYARNSLLTDPSQPTSFGPRYRAFGIEDLATGRLSLHGFQLYPSLLAVGYTLGGLQSGLLTTPFLALLSLVALYLFARRLLGRPAAFLSALLLATNFAQLYFARYPLAEVMVQFLLLSGVLSLALLVDKPRIMLGFAAGSFFGLAHLAKIELVFLPLVLAGFLAFEARRRNLHRGYLVFALVYCGLAAHSLLHALVFARAYFVNHFAIGLNVLERLTPVVSLAAAVFLLFGVGSIMARYVRLGPGSQGLMSRAVPQLCRIAKPGIVLIIVALAFYAYFIRPHSVTLSVPLEQLSDSALYSLNSREGLVRLGWYVTPVGLLAGVVGLCVIIMRGHLDRRGFAFIAIAVLDAAWYSFETRTTPLHFWAARRWVPMAIPGMIVFASFLVVWLSSRWRSRWLGGVVSGALLVGILAYSVDSYAPFWGHEEYDGTAHQLSALAGQFPANSVLLFDEDDVGLRLADPLHFQWDRSTFILWRGTGFADSPGDAIAHWVDQGREVYWIEWSRDDGRGSEPPVGVRATYLSTSVMRVPETVGTALEKPNRIGEFHVRLNIYRVSIDT